MNALINLGKMKGLQKRYEILIEGSKKPLGLFVYNAMGAVEEEDGYKVPLGTSIDRIRIHAKFREDEVKIYAESGMTIPPIFDEHVSNLEAVLDVLETISF